MDRQIRILLIDDHALFREGLSRLLQAEPGFLVAGSCGSTAEAVSVLGNENVDIVLLDYDLGEERGSPILEMARSGKTRCPVLLVTAGMSAANALRLMSSGSSGIFLKSGPPAQLLEAIRKVITGELWIDPVVLQTVVADARERAEDPPLRPFPTPREQAVLNALMEGLSNKEIAASLGIPETAVKWAIQQLLKKSGARGRSELVRLALEKPGWGAPDSGAA
jgi:DNA-binding NarL/FixJ family response regulator